MKVKNWSLSTKVNISKFNQTNENMCILKENKSISFEKKWNQVKKKDLACRSCNCSCVFIFMSDNEDDKDNPACRSCSCSCVHDSVLKPASTIILPSNVKRSNESSIFINNYLAIECQRGPIIDQFEETPLKEETFS